MANEKRNLIDRDALIDSLGASDMEIFAKEVIGDAPTVDAVEVVHGRWLNWKGEPFPPDDFGWEWTCSECKNTLSFEEPVTAEEFASNYCPNCGAKMDGERREGQCLTQEKS